MPRHAYQRPNSLRASLLATIAILVALGAAVEAPANANVINQVINATFDSDLSGWTDNSDPWVNSTWSAQPDANGSSSSGSARISDVDSAPEANFLLQGARKQCTTAFEGSSFQFQAAANIDSGQSTTGTVAVVLAFYAGLNCDVRSLGSVTVLGPPADSQWHTLTLNGTVPPGAQSVNIELCIAKDQAGGEFHGYFDNLSFSTLVAGAPSCTADATHLCLTGNRFEVSIQWTDYNTNVTAAATAVPFVDESGFFYFQNPANIEVMVKVHDACNLFGHFWFFSAATTNVGYTITVTDTKTHQTQTYSNPAHVLSAAVTDQSSFASCP